MRIVHVPLDYDFHPDKVVTNPNPVIEKTGKFSDDGVFSPRIFGRLPSNGREYACDCGQTEGRFHEGAACAACGTPVVCRETVHSKRGFVDLGEYRVVSPLFFSYLQRVVGTVQLGRVLQARRALTVNGLARSAEVGAGFEGLGMLAFAERWREVVEHYAAKKRSDPKIQAYVALLLDNPELVLARRLPIFSHILRPALVVEKQLIFQEVNNVFNLILSTAALLNELSEPERTEATVNAHLWSLQERVNEVFTHVTKALSGKGGFLRSSLLGVRVNFSARCVITPLAAGREHDEIALPYLTFLELYRFQLTNVLARVRGVSLARANDLWCRAQSRFEPTVHRAMEEMIRASDGGLPALLNRNPTISYGSILRVRVTEVKSDLTDLTIGVNTGILGLLAGDFDGDTCNVIALLDRDLQEAFRIFDPRRMSVSRDGLGLNGAMALRKDHALGISVLCEDPR